jgi:hypothetical protein
MQQESTSFPTSFGEADGTIPPGPFARVARALAGRFGRGNVAPHEEPFRDSDFEVDSGYFGRPLGDH